MNQSCVVRLYLLRTEVAVGRKCCAITGLAEAFSQASVASTLALIAIRNASDPRLFR